MRWFANKTHDVQIEHGIKKKLNRGSVQERIAAVKKDREALESSISSNPFHSLPNPELRQFDSISIQSYFELHGPQVKLIADEIELIESKLEISQYSILIEQLQKTIATLDGFAKIPGVTDRDRVIAAVVPNTNNLNAYFQLKSARVAIHDKIAAWQKMLDKLADACWWESVANQVLRKDIQRVANLNASDRLKRLIACYHEWSRQHFFAGYDCKNLLTIYKNYLQPLAKTMHKIREDLKNNPRGYESLLTYHEKNYKVFKYIKRQAIYSMLMRIKYCEENEDIKNDDVLHRILRRISNITGGNLISKKLGDDYRSMDIPTMREFIHITQAEEKFIADEEYSECMGGLLINRPISNEFIIGETLVEADSNREAIQQKIVNRKILNFCFHLINRHFVDADYLSSQVPKETVADFIDHESFSLNKIMATLEIMEKTKAEILNSRALKRNEGRQLEESLQQIFACWNDRIYLAGQRYHAFILERVANDLESSFKSLKKDTEIDNDQRNLLSKCISQFTILIKLHHSQVYLNNSLSENLMQVKVIASLDYAMTRQSNNELVSLMDTTVLQSQQGIIYIFSELKKIYDNNLISNSNLIYFLKILNKMIFEKTIRFLNNSHNTYQLEDILKMLDLFFYLTTSNDFKSRLIYVNEKYILNNKQPQAPYLLAIINNLGETNTIVLCERFATQKSTDDDFKNTIKIISQFSLHTASIRRQLKSLLRDALFKLAHIATKTDADFTTSIKTLHLSNTEVFILWQVLVNKIVHLRNYPDTNLDLINLLTNYLIKTTLEIAQRCKLDGAALKTVTTLINSTPIVISALDIFKEIEIKSKMPTAIKIRQSEIYTHINKSQQDLLSAVRRIWALDLLGLLENYVLRHIHTQQLKSFRDFCTSNRSIFFKENNLNGKLPELIKKFKIRHQDKGIKIYSLIKLHILLTAVTEGKDTGRVIIIELDKLVTQEETHPIETNSKNYLSTLKNIKLAAEHAFGEGADLKYPEIHNTQCIFRLR